MSNKLFEGVGTALVTPFLSNGEIDRDSLEALVEFQIAGGVDFLVPCGSTGESFGLNPAGHVEVISFVVKVANGRVPVMAGTGSNNTSEAVSLTRQAKIAGATGVLVISPYCNKPEPAGMIDYFTQISEVGLPVCGYDIPSRTGRGVDLDIILSLANDGVIAGIKWASEDHNQLMDIISGTPDNFFVLSGNDNSIFELMALGGDGVISVVSNIIPDRMATFMKLFRDNSWSAAREFHYSYLPLMRAMFIETNPIPVKTALSIMGVGGIEANFISPMSRMTESDQVKLEEVMATFNL